MQNRILVVAVLIGALAGLVALVLLLAMEARPDRMVEVVQPPAVAPVPEMEQYKAVATGGTLRGTVVNGLTGEPLEGARVAALKPYLIEKEDELPFWGQLAVEKEVVTGADGTFELDALPKDYWNLWAERRGYSFTTVPRARFDVEHRIELYPGCSIRGRVVFPDDTPAPGVHIEYTPQGTHSEVFGRFRRTSYFTKTDEQGYFQYVDIPPGKFTVEVFHPDHLPAPWTAEPPLQPGENRDLGTHKLDGGFEFEVRVVWRGTEEPVENVKVRVVPVGDPMPRTKTGQTRYTDAEGIARFQGLGGQMLEEPRFTVAAELGYGPVVPDEGGMFAPSSRVTIHLRKDGIVKGRVEHADRRPVERFFASLEPVGHIERQLSVVGRQGEFRLFQVPEGDYLLRIRHHELTDTTRRVSVVGGEEADAGLFVLRPGADLYGVVTRANGAPLEGIVRVTLARRVQDAQGREVYETVAQANVRQDGTYRMPGLAPGSYWIHPESLRDPSLTTEPEPVEIGPAAGGLERNLVLESNGYLRLRFFDLVEGQVTHVVPPQVLLVDRRSGAEVRWNSEGTPLKPGPYELYVVISDEAGVSHRYKAIDVEVQEGRNADPIEIRLYEIR